MELIWAIKTLKGYYLNDYINNNYNSKLVNMYINGLLKIKGGRIYKYLFNHNGN